MSHSDESSTTRRGFLRNAIAAGMSLGALSMAKQALAKPRKVPGKIRIGVQLYSVRDDCAKDIPAVLKAVGKMGYAAVEFAGYYGYEAKDLRKMLDDNELLCCGTHTGINTLMGDELEKTVEFNKTLGNRYLIVPGLPGEFTATADAWRRTADVFNDISDRLALVDMLTGYHNHTEEFKPIGGGKLPWDIFFGNTSRKVVMQFDTGNAAIAKAAAPEFIKRYPGRARTVHMKEYSATNDKAVLGEGEVPWMGILNLCTTIGRTDWYIVEQESYAYPPIECIQKCLDNLEKLIRKQHA